MTQTSMAQNLASHEPQQEKNTTLYLVMSKEQKKKKLRLGQMCRVETESSAAEEESSSETPGGESEILNIGGEPLLWTIHRLH